MNIFNQQGQQVQHQYNAGGDIHVNQSYSPADLEVGLEQLATMIQNAVREGIIDATTADAVKNELIQASSDNKSTIITHLSKATEILKGVSAAEGIVGTIKSLIVAIGKWFI
ncbi:hypothetical protein [Chitinophaga eiseniae]|uniref:Uncharacterized protein n=1 Tax=Chitinophaga eiseniae TaxID=634771 RepID=A0A847SWA4_9BACT|nr:hypothetical protein [Chitinophaga eiseniae]NLR83008.1 hypothetical protein [Chitinophaga eiseniae]